MTATETAVAVPCLRCREETHRTAADWQKAVERCESPVCPICQAIAAAREPLRLGEEATVNEIILRALFDMHRRNLPRLSTADLIVAAWRLSPRRLGLDGYNASFPDSNKVIAALVKIVALGFVARPAQGQYRLTETGLRKTLGGRL